MTDEGNDFGARNRRVLRRQEILERAWLLALSLPALLIVCFVVLMPMTWLVYLSFSGPEGMFTLENYSRMVEQKSYARILLTTLQVAFLTTSLCILLGFPLAYFLAQLPPRRADAFLFVVLLPCLTSLLVRTYAWLVLLQREGLINSIALELSVWEAPLQLVYNITGTLIGMVHIMLPFFVLPVYSAISKIDRSLMTAASSLGANPVAAFWHVYFPLALPGLSAGALIVFILSLGFFVTPAILGGGRVIMVSNQITAILENQFDWGAASALGIVLLSVTLLFLLLTLPLLRFVFRLQLRE